MSPENATLSVQSRRETNMNSVLWVLQGLLALLFLFAGVMKVAMPAEEIAKQMAFSVPFIRFIGVAETLGGLGLILPGISGIGPILTPLAAAGLATIMVGATVVSGTTGGILQALFPLFVGLLLVFVAYRRWPAAR